MSLQWTLQHDSKSVLTKISFSVNICCLQNMNYSFPWGSFEPDFHLAWKDAQLSLPAFQGFIWFTSMTSGDFSFCMSSGRNSPLFSYRWLGYMKLWRSHYTFVEFLFLIAEKIFFLFKKEKKKETTFRFMKICYKFLSWLANSLHCKIQSKLKNNWKWNCSNIINSEVKGASGSLSQLSEKTTLMLGEYLIIFF